MVANWTGLCSYSSRYVLGPDLEEKAATRERRWMKVLQRGSSSSPFWPFYRTVKEEQRRQQLVS
jgi:hypothetical protein